MKTENEPVLGILCLDDEPGVLHALMRDLEPFEEHFALEAVGSVEEAEAVLEEWKRRGVLPALALCDHLLLGATGTDYLIALRGREETRRMRKVLITAQAGQMDTIRAVNLAGLDYYIAKPWEPTELRAVVRDQLTSYVLEAELQPIPFMGVLDAERLGEAIRRWNLVGDE